MQFLITAGKGKWGAGSEAPRKSFLPCLFYVRKPPFLKRGGTTKRHFHSYVAKSRSLDLQGPLVELQKPTAFRMQVIDREALFKFQGINFFERHLGVWDNSLESQKMPFCVVGKHDFIIYLHLGLNGFKVFVWGGIEKSYQLSQQMFTT